MATEFKVRRGTTAEHAAFTGAEGEITLDTNKDTLVVHDAYTAGGHAMLREDLNNLADAAIDISKISSTGGSANQALKMNAAGTGLEYGIAGGVIAVRSAHYTTQMTVNDGSATYLNVEVTMPPAQSANSRYLIMGYGHADNDSSDSWGIGMNVWVENQAGNSYWFSKQGTHHNYTSGGGDMYFHANIMEVDSGEVTPVVAGQTRKYRLYGESHSGTARWNPSGVGGSGDSMSGNPWDGNTIYGTRLVVMELAGDVF